VEQRRLALQLGVPAHLSPQRRHHCRNRSAAWFMIAQVSSQAKVRHPCLLQTVNHALICWIVADGASRSRAHQAVDHLRLASDPHPNPLYHRPALLT
jgi:hypothetical protein